MSSSQDAHAGSEKTPYGFQWGNTVISRACEHKGHRLLMIETPRERMMIRVTPSGLIRVDGFEANTVEKLSVTF